MSSMMQIDRPCALKLASLVVALLLAGCAGTLPPEVAQRQDEPETDQSTAGPRAEPEQSGPAETTVEQSDPPGALAPGEPGEDPQPAPSQLQGNSCEIADREVSFVTDRPLVACETVSVTVTAPAPHVWVMVGISVAQEDPGWTAGATVTSCGDAGCSWGFANVAVPCEVGPYALHFIVDAVDDDPQVGVAQGSCQP